MGDRFLKRYRTDSLRLQNWDYASSAIYFITICTKNRLPYFGEIIDGKMKLSPLGAISNVLWYEIKNHTKNCQLGEFVVMPNHIHGNIVLMDRSSDSVDSMDSVVETRHALSVRLGQSEQSKFLKTIGQSRFQNQGKNSISSIVGSYKSAVSRHAHRMGFDFQWQGNYWEHIVRNENELHRIENYIQNNPTNWAQDKLNGGDGNAVLENRAVYNEEDWMI